MDAAPSTGSRERSSGCSGTHGGVYEEGMNVVMQDALCMIRPAAVKDSWLPGASNFFGGSRSMWHLALLFSCFTGRFVTYPTRQ